MSSSVRPAPPSSETLVELLQRRAADQPLDRAFEFLLDGETTAAVVTYSELDRRARAVAALLQRQRRGSRALIAYDSGPDFVTAFFGCAYAGLIAVPVAPPSRRTAGRLRAIAETCEPSVILSASGLPRRASPALAGTLAGAAWIDVSTVTDDLASEWKPAAVRTTDTALLQFTSGSTALPRGVVISHGHLWHNQVLMLAAFRSASDSIVLGWLPLHHDMGLIGTVLHPLFLGAPGVLMSPAHFMERPLRWVHAMSRYRATISGGPNFAFDLCARRATAADCETLDLSSWRVAFNGAEPVRPDTLRRFARVFAGTGFAAEAFHPCYGLAEATLFVAGRARGSGPLTGTFERGSLETNAPKAAPSVPASPDEQSARDRRITRELIAYEPATAGQQLLIVHPEQERVCGPGEVGEIWVAGPSVAQRYWNDPDETHRVFEAQIPEMPARFLRTGDLAFVHDGSLFITGRLKDLIIIRGRNLHPQDIENTVGACHPALQGAAGAAFAVEEDGEERLVVVHELTRGLRRSRHDEITPAARRAVSDAHDVRLHALVLVKAGAIPRTTSGKLQRRLCRMLLLNGTLEAVSLNSAPGPSIASVDPSGIVMAAQPSEGPATEAGAIVQREAARLLGVDAAEVDLNTAPGALGLDSLMSVELQHRLERHFDVLLSQETMLEAGSLWALCDAIVARQGVRHVQIPLRSASGDQFPLSLGQRALLFLDQLDAAGPVALLTRAVRMDGPLDVAALQHAVGALVQRHDALRTTFVRSASEPAQMVHPVSRIDLSIEYAAGWSDDALRTRVQAFADLPMHLERGPLVRAALYRRADVEHVFVLTVHHSIADFWSLAVMVRDLEELYAAACEQRPARLGPIAATFRDYVATEQEVLDGPEAERSWEFWQRQFEGVPLTLDLAAHRTRPAVQSLAGAAFPCAIGPTLTARLRALAASRNATLHATLTAAFQALLHRYAGQRDFVVGTPVASRGSARWRDMIGYCVNMLPMRAHVSTNTTFEALVDQARTNMTSALAHQALPFPAMVGRLRPARDASRPPVVQCTFAFLSDRIFGRPGLAALAAGSSSARVRFAGLSLVPFQLEHRSAQFDLSLTLAETGDGLAGRFEYNTGLFDKDGISRMSDHWRTLLEELVSNPAVPVGELPLLTARERLRLLDICRVTKRPVPDQAVHRLFEAQVEHGASGRIVDEQAELSYRDLNARANQWANRLRRMGVAAETRVGLCTGRSIRMLLGALAILKAGAAYVPVDPRHPRRRIADVLADCAAPVLVTDRSALPLLPPFRGRIVCLDDDATSIDDEDAGNSMESVDAERAAYVLYTSGSTGSPNGVTVTHRSLVNLLESMRREPGLGPGDRLLSVTTLAFDIAGLELFLPLLAGASVMIAGDETVVDAIRLARLISSWDATVMQATPATWRSLLDAGWAGKPDLKVLCGGEALMPDLAARLVPRCAELWNMYGPTETTIWSTIARITGIDERVPIGRPIDNTEVYVLDAHLQPVPTGVAGDIHIGGAGLARGYLGRPDLTAMRFIPHPFSDEPGARLYCTGDRGCYRAGGALDFLGRVDDQVKLRGFRIELREIEAALLKHPSVLQAAAVGRDDARGEMSLIAYVVVADVEWCGGGQIESLLREHVATMLPAYMVPAAIVRLSGLPLTPNGKVDRRRLPAPDWAARAVSTPPVTSTERLLVEIWCDVLKLDRIGTGDNFFDLGGHSLLLNEVRSKIASALNRDVPILEFFRHSTVRALVHYLDHPVEGGATADASPAPGLDGARVRRAAGVRRQELRRRRRAVSYDA